MEYSQRTWEFFFVEFRRHFLPLSWSLGREWCSSRAADIMAISPGPALQEFLIRRTQHQAANPATANYWNIFPLTQIFSPPTAALQHCRAACTKTNILVIACNDGHQLKTYLSSYNYFYIWGPQAIIFKIIHRSCQLEIIIYASMLSLGSDHDNTLHVNNI